MKNRQRSKAMIAVITGGGCEVMNASLVVGVAHG